MTSKLECFSTAPSQVDWSSTNVLAVALGSHIYLWSAATGNIVQLCELEGQEDYVTR